ncbi:protein of unknown function [Azospirillum baldaniorum]|uniref:DUF2336 domain-containing protein n=1 Tax=Azospirillum baldaniorum TaxID=1064539 RepID=A0A9P1JRH4_9PROT|nr:protein of unknown function [Azospirillum baldaniorum]
MSQRSLSQKDVERLLAAPDAQARIDTMTHLVRDLEAGDLAEAERALAMDILQRFAADAVTAVREAVAWQIHNSSLLTEGLAEKLARDVDRVAFPILRHAEKLSEGLLLDILRERRPAKELAIAGRRSVSPVVSDALVRNGNVIVITELLRNRGAVIPEPSLHSVLDRWGGVATVKRGHGGTARPVGGGGGEADPLRVGGDPQPADPQPSPQPPPDRHPGGAGAGGGDSAPPEAADPARGGRGASRPASADPRAAVGAAALPRAVRRGDRALRRRDRGARQPAAGERPSARLGRRAARAEGAVRQGGPVLHPAEALPRRHRGGEGAGLPRR